MTKPRPPLTIDSALARIAGQLSGGWAAMAELAGRKERTVRNWGDPDTPERIPMDAAIALDIAFQRAGGAGAPIFETYALQLEVAREQAFADQIELARRTMAAIREGGQAHEALVAASLPDAAHAARLVARREVEEAIATLTATLPLLTDGAGPEAAGARATGGTPK